GGRPERAAARAAAHAGIMVDAAQVDQIEQSGAILAQSVTGAIGERSRKPIGKALGDLLLKEKRLVDPVGVTLEGERAVLEMRQDQRRDSIVVIQQIALA